MIILKGVRVFLKSVRIFLKTPKSHFVRIFVPPHSKDSLVNLEHFDVNLMNTAGHRQKFRPKNDQILVITGVKIAWVDVKSNK